MLDNKIFNASLFFCFVKALPECVERFTFVLEYSTTCEPAWEFFKRFSYPGM